MTEKFSRKFAKFSMIFEEKVKIRKFENLKISTFWTRKKHDFSTKKSIFHHRFFNDFSIFFENFSIFSKTFEKFSKTFFWIDDFKWTVLEAYQAVFNNFWSFEKPWTSSFIWACFRGVLRGSIFFVFGVDLTYRILGLL